MQSIPPCRIIVVNDGSTDGTAEILRSREEEGEIEAITIIRSKTRIGHIQQIRNVGLALLANDQVDWIYSGDSDILLEPDYCKTIMQAAESEGAYIASGQPGKQRALLPFDGCQMIRHKWLRKHGMTLKWESVYICTAALLDDHNTLLCRDLIATEVRDERVTKPERAYKQGQIAALMGARSWQQAYATLGASRWSGLRAGLAYFHGSLTARREVSREMAGMYRKLMKNAMLQSRLGRSKMFKLKGKNVVCRPTD